MVSIDVLCVGHASYDLIFTIPHHPTPDEKMVADNLLGCGGGPAANAAVMVAKLGLKAAFAGYLGRDLYGEKHYRDLQSYGVDVSQIVRGSSSTPLSTILVKPDGARTLINYKGDTKALAANAIDFTSRPAKVILFDGHEPLVSVPLAEQAKAANIPTVLDAGSVHSGTLALQNKVDYLICSEKFALQSAPSLSEALAKLAQYAPYVVITLGDRGLIWRNSQGQGSLPAYSVNAIDTTGAGDAFHGAFAAALTLGLTWEAILSYASAAGALCCTKLGARFGLPDRAEHLRLWQSGLENYR